MLTKLAGLAAPTVLSHVDTLVEPLEKTLLTKLKSDAVKQVQQSLRRASHQRSSRLFTGLSDNLRGGVTVA